MNFLMTSLKFLLGVLIAVGIFLVIGAAGNDCDGKCMENSLPLADLLMYMLAGIAMIATGAFGLMSLKKDGY
jgi:hypothetical protein